MEGAEGPKHYDSKKAQLARIPQERGEPPPAQPQHRPAESQPQKIVPKSHRHSQCIHSEAGAGSMGLGSRF